MRLLTYAQKNPNGRIVPRAAVMQGDQAVDLSAANAGLPVGVAELLADWPRYRESVTAAAVHGPARPVNELTLLAPIPRPEKVICIGLNYADHAAESGAEIPSEPVVFCKFPTAVTGHRCPIQLPSASRRVDYEAELVVVIGRGGRDISVDRAADHIGGYTCGHDVSARDWQLKKPGGQWLLGKTFDTFAPMGPWIVTPDEVPNPGELDIRLRLNDQVMQDSNTCQLIFGIPQLIAYVSQVCTLKPGDVLFTGTPPGVGGARTPPVYLQPGDCVLVEIDGVGVLENHVVS